MKISIKIIPFLMILITALVSVGCGPKNNDVPPVTYTVTFNSQFNNTESATVMPNPTSITVESGQTVGTLPTAPSMSGYKFGGWWTKKGGTGSAFTENTTVTSDIMVYAYWVNYQVIFSNDGATYASRGVVSPSKTVSSLPASPTKTGYNFAGWYTSPTGGTEFSASTEVTADITVYARWTTSTVYVVTYDSQSETAVGTRYVVSPATTVSPWPADPTRAFYTFGGWYTEGGGGGTAFTAGTPVTASITIYANWTATPGYTVKYDSYGGTSVENQYAIPIPPATTATVGTLPTPPTKRCYKFDNWYTDTTYTTPITASSTVGADITVYAKWDWDYPSTTYPLRTPPFEIGDYGPSCIGKVFYITNNGNNGLEVAPPNWYEGGEGPSLPWIYGDPVTDTNNEVSQRTQSTSNGNTLTAIGTGLANSNAIVAQVEHAGGTTTPYAAKLCLDYSVGEGAYIYADWFLPSKDELAQMYIRRDVKSSGGFADDGYWSSSEYGQWDAWSQWFSDGRQTGTYKSGGRLVRPVRAF